MSLIYWPQVAGPVAASSSLANDPYFSSVVQLAHVDTGFSNSCPRGNNFVAITNCVISTAQKQWGAGSARMTVPVVGYMDAASHADYNLGTNDWTLEFWVRPDTLTRNGVSNSLTYFDCRDNSLTAQWVPTVSAGPSDTGNIRYLANGAARIDSGNGVMQVTTWNYVCVCRNSGTTRLFHGLAGGNATQYGSDFVDGNTYVQCRLRAGAAGNAASNQAMYIDDVRLTNGVGRYTTTYTVPAGPFPNQ